MSQKEEKKLISAFRATFSINFTFKVIDDFLKNLFNNSYNCPKNLSLETQKQLKTEICDIFTQIKDKKTIVNPKEASKILLLLSKKLPFLDLISHFEFEFALEVKIFSFFS